MNDVLDRYGELLSEVDHWFAACVERHPDQIVCGRRCSACCRGVFDITFMDALHLRRGFKLLAEPEKKRVLEKAAARVSTLHAEVAEFTAPWILNDLTEEELNGLMPEDDHQRCVLLSEGGSCLVYEHRPMTCRLNGIPQIDLDGTWLSDEWCTLNFMGMPPDTLEDIRYPFSELFAQELLLFRELTGRIIGRTLHELDTIIPAALFLDGDMVELVRKAVLEGSIGRNHETPLEV
jgi:Fe-S-cluster containining protein